LIECVPGTGPVAPGSYVTTGQAEGRCIIGIQPNVQPWFLLSKFLLVCPCRLNFPPVSGPPVEGNIGTGTGIGIGGGGIIGREKKQSRIKNFSDVSESTAPLPILLDRLGGMMTEVRWVFNSRCIGKGEDARISRSEAIGALMDLRIEPVLARECLMGHNRLTDANGDFDFASFVTIHASASGYDGAGESHNGAVNVPGELWVENGNSGMWVRLSGAIVGRLRSVFDSKSGNASTTMGGTGDRDSGDRDSMIYGAENLKRAVKSLLGDAASWINDEDMTKYLAGRSHVIGETTTGAYMVGFAEFVRCWLEFGGSSDGGVGDLGLGLGLGGGGREVDMYNEYDDSEYRDVDFDVHLGGEARGLSATGDLLDVSDDEEGIESFANLSQRKRKPKNAAANKTGPGDGGLRLSGAGKSVPAHWHSTQRKEKAKTTPFSGTTVGGMTLGAGGGAGGGSANDELRVEMKNRALVRAWGELSGGNKNITLLTLRKAMQAKGRSTGKSDDEALMKFISARGGRGGKLTKEQFFESYETGVGGADVGSLSLPFSDGNLVVDGGEIETEGLVGADYNANMEDRGNTNTSGDDFAAGDFANDDIVDQGTEDAIERTFAMYDLNGDGVISYLELKTVFMQQGRDASDYEIRNWIRKRDTSGTGSVTFSDFRRAYLASGGGK